MHKILRAARTLLVGALAACALAVSLVPARAASDGPAPFIPYPRIEQAAGAIQLLRQAGPDLEGAVLRTLNSVHQRAEIIAGPPPVPEALHPAPRVVTLVRDFAGLGPTDDVRAWTDVLRNSPSNIEGIPVLITWRMADGRFFVIRERGTDHGPDVPAPSRLNRASALSIVLAGVALVATTVILTVIIARRESRPLRDLAAAAAAFDGYAPGQAVDGGGAPDVRRLVEAIRVMQERVTMLLQERSFLIGAISHDMKTYLTRLRLRAEHVADPGEQGRVVADLDAMTDLIETALAFARGTTVSQRRSLVDLADLAAVEAAERAAFGRQITVVGDETSDALVAGDPVALRRVLSNLVDNAEKFGRGRVEVAVEIGPDACHVLVDDDGPGVSQAQRAAVFSPFYRVDGSRSSRTGGSGLGLAIARQIVEAHGGTISIGDSALGGARLAVTLPAIRQQHIAT